jgi:hypothetical protein
VYPELLKIQNAETGGLGFFISGIYQAAAADPPEFPGIFVGFQFSDKP